MNKMIINVLILLLCTTPAAFGCINNTDIQDIADATGTQYILWDNIFSYYCDSLDDMTEQINENNDTIHKAMNYTNSTIDNYLILNNLTSEHYINMSNQTIYSYLRLNNLTMDNYINMYNLSLNYYVNKTGTRIDVMNDTLHNITMTQSVNILDDYKDVSDEADREIINQIDSQLSRLRSDKVSYSQMNNLTDSIKMDVYKIVNNNKTSPTFYGMLFLANIIMTVLIILFMGSRIGQLNPMSQGYASTDYTNPPKASYKSVIPTKVSSIPSIVVTNENIVNQKKTLRNLKYEALKLAGKDTIELKKELMKDIDENMIKDEDDLKDHYTKLKAIRNEEKKEKSADDPRFRVPKKKNKGEQQNIL